MFSVTGNTRTGMNSAVPLLHQTPEVVSGQHEIWTPARMAASSFFRPDLPRVLGFRMLNGIMEIA
jgi:hypothetical protein